MLTLLPNKKAYGGRPTPRLSGRTFYCVATFATSFLLSLLAACAYLRSYRHIDCLDLQAHRTRVTFISFAGGLHVLFFPQLPPDDESWRLLTSLPIPEGQSLDPWSLYTTDTAPIIQWRAGGVGIRRGTFYGTVPYDALLIPFWLTLPILLSLTLWRGIVMFHAFSHPKESQYCPACNYDLRASPARCPECGALPDDLREAASTSSSPSAPTPPTASTD